MSNETFEVWAIGRSGEAAELRIERPDKADAIREATLIAQSARDAIGGGAVSVWVQREGEPDVTLWAAGLKTRESGSEA